MKFHPAELLAVKEARANSDDELQFLTLLAERGFAVVPAVKCGWCVGEGCEECNQTGMEIF